MTNIISSKQRERSQAFENLTQKQFELIPGGRDALLKEIGDEAVGLAQVIDNYFLPNVRADGYKDFIEAPKDFDVESEKTPLVPILPYDLSLHIGPSSSDLIYPTPKQLQVAGLDETDEGQFSTRFKKKIDKTLSKNSEFASYKTDSSFVERAILRNGEKRTYCRPMAFVRSEKNRIDNIAAFLHESKHVEQFMNWQARLMDDIRSIEYELPAYRIDLKATRAVWKLLGIEEDVYKCGIIEEAVDRFTKYCDENQRKYCAEEFVDWFRDVYDCQGYEQYNKDKVWKYMTNAS
ncbi:MAG: hypothetical protein LBL08_00825 [Candidatus Nomurabacteria bacterium]|jgi:hypothetical protein|nr:hypothetical protein [Candidatus Nomurabacteria bacterium]